MSDLVSVEELEQLKEIMEDEFEMLITMFVDDSSELLNTIVSTTQASDADGLRIASHTLKGSSSNMCVPSIANICEEIENKAKNADFSGLDTLITDLQSVHPKVVEILKAF